MKTESHGSHRVSKRISKEKICYMPNGRRMDQCTCPINGDREM